MSRRRRLFFILGALLLLVVVIGGGWIVGMLKGVWPPPGVGLKKGVVFGQGGGRDLKLDFVRPQKATGKLPVLVFIHGGGWAGGKKEDFHPFMFHFSKSGIFCATVEYRLAPKDRFPAQIEDVKCAVRWLRAHADDCGIDPARIVAIGISAGAHLAALLATTAGLPELEGAGGNAGQSSAVSAAIGLAGPYDLALGYRHSVHQRKAEGDTVRHLLESLLGGSPDQIPDAYRRASPFSHVGPKTAPMMLIHGADDPLVPVEQAEVFAKKLAETGVPVEFLRLEDGTHDSFGKEPDKAIRAITDYVERQLKAGSVELGRK